METETIKYSKRAKGGYYAIVNTGKREIFIVVYPIEHHTPNKTYRIGWYAARGERSATADTRKDAVLQVATHFLVTKIN